jgi:O-antigen ligase
MTDRIYRRLLQGGVIASLFIVFFVFGSLLFPYITSKQLSFNILMELLFAVYLVLVLVYPKYRPRKDLILYGLGAYFLAIIVSCIASVNFGLSFWGNAERMLGFFHLLHFLFFYLIVVTVFRTWREWRLLLISSVATSAAVALIGIFGGNPYSTIGNTTYVSAYLMFNMFFSLILFFRENNSWRYLYLLPFVVYLPAFAACRTSGAIIGLFFGLMSLVLSLAVSHENRQVKKYSRIFIAFSVLAVILVFSQKNASWFQESFLRNLTSQKATFQTRLISWHSAWLDFPNHPFFGTGFGNYAIVFDKYFDSKFFDYSKTEVYFDRAHNNLVDIVSTTGLFGLLAYLSIFAAAAYYLINLLRRRGKNISFSSDKGRANWEIAIVIALLLAYFIQNLAVFDSYVTYICLMITLAFVRFSFLEEESFYPLDSRVERGALEKWEGMLLVTSLLLSLFFVWNFNVKAWKTFNGVIGGYRYLDMGDYQKAWDAYRHSLNGGFLEHDARSSLINFVLANPAVIQAFPNIEGGNFIDYVASLVEMNAKENPVDSLTLMQLAQVYDIAARYSSQDLDKFNEYSEKSLEAIDKSIASSPGRATTYFIKGQILLLRGEKDEAIKVMDYGISLNPKFSEGYCRLAQFYILLDQKEAMSDSLEKCIELGGIGDISSGPLLIRALNYYAANERYDEALALSERLLAIYPNDPQVMLNLAKLYYVNDEPLKAYSLAAAAAKIDVEASTSWKTFLEKINEDNPETNK